MYAYPISFAPDRLPTGDSVVLATCPDLPELITQGDDLDNARAQARDALNAVIAMYVAERRPLPPASLPRPPAPDVRGSERGGEEIVEPDPEVAIRARLAELMRERKVTQVALATAMGVQRKAVERMLNFDHRFDLGRVTAAFAALGWRLDVRAIGPRAEAA